MGRKIFPEGGFPKLCGAFSVALRMAGLSSHVSTPVASIVPWPFWPRGNCQGFKAHHVPWSLVLLMRKDKGAPELR